MTSLIRDSMFGQIVNSLSNGRYFTHLEQEPNFVVPPYLLRPSGGPSTVRLPVPSFPQQPEKAIERTFTLSAPSNRSSVEVQTAEPSNVIDERERSDRIEREDSDETLAAKNKYASPSLKGASLHPEDTHHNVLAELERPEQRYGEVHDCPGLVDWYGPDDPENPQ